MSTVNLTSEDSEGIAGRFATTFVELWARRYGPRRSFNVMAIPTLMVYRDGEPLFKEAGVGSDAQIRKLVASARERKNISNQETFQIDEVSYS